MNELIKKLANESGYYLYDLTETHGIKTVETDSKDEWITLEKFAELIVKECIIRAEREWIRNGSDTEHNQAVSKVIESIKEHFGDEE
jgi:hypothetical protein